MIYILRNSDGTIKTYSERADLMHPIPGETLDLLPCSLVEFSKSFFLSCQGKSAELVTARVGDPDLTVEISCPGCASVQLDINGTLESVTLAEGAGQIQLSTAVPGVFILQPADRRTYPAAGNGLLTIEVLP